LGLRFLDRCPRLVAVRLGGVQEVVSLPRDDLLDDVVQVLGAGLGIGQQRSDGIEQRGRGGAISATVAPRSAPSCACTSQTNPRASPSLSTS
jgi:hypothetical protein